MQVSTARPTQLPRLVVTTKSIVLTVATAQVTANVRTALLHKTDKPTALEMHNTDATPFE